MSLLVVGSVALDTVETPFGRAEDALGGSATFFSAAASCFCPVQLVGVIGDDFPADALDFLVERDVDLSGLERAAGESFRWSGVYSFDRWAAVFGGETTRYDRIYQGLGNSLVLAVVTVAIVLLVLLPTIVLVELRFPQLRRLLEAVCLLPIMIPAIVMVVGLAPTYAVVTQIFGSGAWTLAFAYGITVLPYAYRAIQSNVAAVDLVTLSEAARSLGAGWGTVFWRVLVPNLRRGILAASALSVAVVLGEFTIASLLSRVNLQTSLLLVSQSDPFVAVIFALLALVFAFILLFVVDRVVSARRRARKG